MDSYTSAGLKVARDYFISKQNAVLIPNRDFGRRKFLHVGINTKTSSAKSPTKQKSVEEEVPPVSDPEVYTLPDLTMKAANKQWVHPPDALSSGHIVYNVKFLGECEVECPKGTDVVRDAIRKRKFNKHIRKAEGQKTPKVELTISADGVTVQDPKTKIIRHQYPLHRISYCADDKTDKRMFTFIAKSGESNTHYCYVFDSEKCAEEITLTIGQAFDIAYRRFLDTSSKDLDMKKQYLLLQKKVQALEQENQALKRRIMELEQSSPKDSLGQINNQQSNGDNEIDVGMTNDSMSSFLTLLPSTHLDDSTTDVYETIQEPAVGRRLENLITDSPQSAQTNGTSSSAAHSGVPAMGGLLSPPPKSTRSRSHGTPSQSTNPFQSKNGHTGGSNPFGPSESASSNATVDPFGMPEFKPSTDSKDLDRAIQNVDQELLDIQTGFSAGLSFGTEDFSLADFDPLNHD